MSCGKAHSSPWGSPAGPFCLLLLLALLSACAPLHEPKVPGPEPVHVLTPERPFGPGMSLKAFLGQALERQYPAQLQAFAQPERIGEYFVELAHESVLVHLAAGVRSYAAGAAGLAAGFDTGDILIWSDWPCPALTLPEAGPVDLLAWDGVSAFLGASNDRRGVLDVYDLRLCAHIGTVPGEGAPAVAALSPSGAWVALVDQKRRLLAGPVDGTPRQAGVLRFQPLTLVFSPREGLLFSVDQAGWLLHWRLPELEVLEQMLIPGGPFQRAIFDGQRLLLEPVPRPAETAGPEDERGLAIWDVPSSAMVALDDGSVLGFALEGFALEGGLLTYRTADRRWIRKMRLGRPQPKVWASPSTARLRLRDVDGLIRCYSAKDGLSVEAGQCRADDWEELDVSLSGRFHWGNAGYALADPVVVRGGLVLYSRSLSEDRFFLWWGEPEEGGFPAPDLDSERTGLLPVRQSLRMEIPPFWMPVPFQQTDSSGEEQ